MATIGEYVLSEGSVREARARVEKIARKAARLGVGRVAMTEVAESFSREPLKDSLGHLVNGEWLIRRYVVVRVEGDTPRLAGWALAATLQHEALGNVIRKAPGFEDSEIPARFRDSGRVCEQCDSIRNRVDTFVVHNADTGEWRQVGRNCLASFIGGTNPQALLTMLELYGTLHRDMSGSEEDGFTGGYRGEYRENLETVMTHAVAVVRAYGYVSGAKARDTLQPSTRDMTHTNMDNLRRKKRDRFGAPEYITPTDADGEKAAAVIAWVRGWSEDERDAHDYARNLTIVMGDDAIAPRSVGIAVSAIAAYGREMEKRERAAAAARQPSEWQGTIGKRQIIEALTVDLERCIEGRYGAAHVYQMHDASGNRYKWIASNEDLRVGETVTLKATIKDHAEWQGRKETVITRCAVV